MITKKSDEDLEIIKLVYTFAMKSIRCRFRLKFCFLATSLEKARREVRLTEFSSDEMNVSKI